MKKKREQIATSCRGARSLFLSLFGKLKLTEMRGTTQYVGTISMEVHRRLGWRSHQRLSRSNTRSKARRHAWEQKRCSGDRRLRWNSSYHPGRSQEHEKKFSWDDPRAAYGIGFLFLAFLLPYSVPAALGTTDLLPIGGLPILMPGFPLSPFRRFFPAMLAAVTRQRMIRPEYPAAAFQQASPAPRPAGTPFCMRTYSFNLILEAA